MQKLINVLAVMSFAVSAATVAGIAYLYTQRDTLKEQATEQVTELVTDAVSGAVDGIADLPGEGLAMPSSPAGQGIPMPF